MKNARDFKVYFGKTKYFKSFFLVFPKLKKNQFFTAKDALSIFLFVGKKTNFSQAQNISKSI